MTATDDWRQRQFFLCVIILPPVAMATTESMAIYPQPTMSSDDFKSKLAKLCPKPAVLGRMLLDLAVGTLEAVPNSPVTSKRCLMTVVRSALLF